MRAALAEFDSFLDKHFRSAELLVGGAILGAVGAGVFWAGVIFVGWLS